MNGGTVYVHASNGSAVTVRSIDAVTMRVPSGLNAALLTSLLSSSNSAPVAAFHTRAVRSPDAVTISAPSGLKAALESPMPWPSSSRNISPVTASIPALFGLRTL